MAAARCVVSSVVPQRMRLSVASVETTGLQWGGGGVVEGWWMQR